MCGAVRFATTGEPRGMSVCHCEWCQRRTGTAFGTEVIFRAEDVRMTGQPPAQYRHRSDESGRWLDECGLRELHVFTRSRRKWGDASPLAEVYEGYHRKQ